MGPITLQRTRRCVLASIGMAATPSSSSTTGTVSWAPRIIANGGDITIAPPKPVMPRITPAAIPMASARTTCSGAKESTVHGDRLAGDERGVFGGEEERRARDVGLLGEAAERDA